MNDDQDRSQGSPGSQTEPLFIALGQNDQALQVAYANAAETIPLFIEHLKAGDDSLYSVKLKFKDPDQSENRGEDSFLFLWVVGVRYHETERCFSAFFFEMPSELRAWHDVGEQIVFDGEDIFDWMVLHEGHLHGGFTLRVAREELPENEQKSYDDYIGVSTYEPLPV